MPGPRPVLCTFPEDFLQEAIDTVGRRTVAVQTVQRFRLVLLLHERPSLGNDEAAAAVGLSARQVQRWRSRWATGDFSVEDHPGRGRKAAFSPLDQALIQAMACEVVAETKEPLSRQSLADLVRRGRATLGKKISRSTVWRMLHEAAIKPWQYEHWIFPRDPRFAEKAGPILDLYAGMWEGKPLSTKDYVLCLDEKTSIQARQRSHDEMPPKPKRSRRIESEYERQGALQYLAAWDVHRGIVLGRCEAKTGIKPPADWWIRQVLEPTRSRLPRSQPGCSPCRGRNWLRSRSWSDAEATDVASANWISVRSPVHVELVLTWSRIDQVQREHVLIGHLHFAYILDACEVASSGQRSYEAELVGVAAGPALALGHHLHVVLELPVDEDRLDHQGVSKDVNRPHSQF